MQLGGKYPVYQTSLNEGNRWNGAAATIINNATPGTSIFFDNIKVGPGWQNKGSAPDVIQFEIKRYYKNKKDEKSNYQVVFVALALGFVVESADAQTAETNEKRKKENGYYQETFHQQE